MQQKSRAVPMVIACIIVAVALVALVCLWSAPRQSADSWVNDYNAQLSSGSAGSGESFSQQELDLSGVNKLVISARNAHVRVAADGEGSFFEANQPIWQVERRDDRLNLRTRGHDSWLSNEDEGEIVVHLPASYAQQLKVETASGNIDLAGMKLSELEVDTASGGVKVSAATARQIDVESVSGGVRVESCVADQLECASTSGQLRLSGCVVSGQTELSTVSGGIRLELVGQGSGVEIETVSGATVLDVTSGAAYRLERVETISGSVNGRQSAGENGTPIRFESVSGSLDIQS